MQAAGDASLREAFLSENSGRILHLAGKLLNRPVTKSDDEWSVALMAASEALDHYDPEKGDFWSYASVVIKSRLLNLIKSEQRSAAEIAVSPDVFTGEATEDDPELSMKLAVQKKTAVEAADSGNPLADEIFALQEELKRYDISFFDLTECSPRAEKTRKGCAEVITAFFLPPPLLELLKSSGLLPAKELASRSGQSRKLLDKYRKYLIASALILDGDYPGLAEYLEGLRPKKGRLRAFRGSWDR